LKGEEKLLAAIS